MIEYNLRITVTKQNKQKQPERTDNEKFIGIYLVFTNNGLKN